MTSPQPEPGALRGDAIAALRDLDTDDDALRSLLALYLRDEPEHLAQLGRSSEWFEA